MPIKPLTFKGDKKPKKRKHRDEHNDDEGSVSRPHPQTASETAAGVDPSEDDSWTTPDAASDIHGPTLIVLPTQPPTCLASDAHGNVFASPLENIVDDVLETAEPHDVRQVWVASTVAGTGGQINLKASHGGYLSCDSIGVLGARREARGLEEGFMVEQIEVDDGEGEAGTETFGTSGSKKVRWRIQTKASKGSEEGEKGKRYLCAIQENNMEREGDADTSGEKSKKRSVAISLRGDGEADSPSTHLVLKMQNRFKPRVQQNKETKANQKISRRELEQAVGRKLDDDEVKRLKRARKEGNFYEEVLDVRVKGKHDKFAS
ncbi:hypothetical protein ABEF95_012456 [Exophiala dermatitidis]